MKRFFLQCSTLFFALLILSSCRSDFRSADKAMGVIPANATTITRIQVADLMEKSDFKAFQQLPVFRDMVKEAQSENAALAAIMENPEQSGADLNSNFYLFTELSEQNPENGFSGMVIPLADASDFTKMIKAIDSDIEIQQENGIQLFRPNGLDNFLAWNEQFAIVGGSNHEMSISNDKVAALLQQKPANSIAKNKEVNKLMNKGKDHDILTWVNLDVLADYKDGAGMLKSLGFDGEALRDNYIHAYVDFEDGQVSSESEFLFRNAFTKDVDLLFKDHVKTDFRPYVPAQNLATVFTAALDINGIYQLMTERPHSKTAINMGLKQFDLTVDEVLKSLGGDILGALYTNGGKEVPTGLFITDIKNEEKISALLDVGVQQKMLSKINDQLYSIPNAAGLMRMFGLNDGMQADNENKDAYLLMAHDLLFISADQSLLETIKSGGFKSSKQLPKNLNQQLQESIFAGYVDFIHFGELSQREADFPMEKVELSADRKKANMDLLFKNKSQNSLKSLLWMMNDEYVKDKAEGMDGEESI